MSKIVKAINIMIENTEKITAVIRKDNELFFKFLDKQKWSIIKLKIPSDSTKPTYSIFYYSSELSLEELSKFGDDVNANWDNLNMVTYSTSIIKTREAFESFEQLYTTLNEKIYNINEVFDEIFEIEEKI